MKETRYTEEYNGSTGDVVSEGYKRAFLQFLCLYFYNIIVVHFIQLTAKVHVQLCVVMVTIPSSCVVTASQITELHLSIASCVVTEIIIFLAFGSKNSDECSDVGNKRLGGGKFVVFSWKYTSKVCDVLTQLSYTLY